MSHSRRKTPIVGHCGNSEKEDKRRSNRKLRSKVKMLLKQPIEKIEEVMIPKKEEVMDEYNMNKDGKGYIGGIKTKDKEYYNKLMRK